MKRNRKAEVRKKERILSAQETERKRTAILLSELETACGQILLNDFEFSQKQVDGFWNNYASSIRHYKPKYHFLVSGRTNA